VVECAGAGPLRWLCCSRVARVQRLVKLDCDRPRLRQGQRRIFGPAGPPVRTPSRPNDRLAIARLGVSDRDPRVAIASGMRHCSHAQSRSLKSWQSGSSASFCRNPAKKWKSAQKFYDHSPNSGEQIPEVELNAQKRRWGLPLICRFSSGLQLRELGLTAANLHIPGRERQAAAKGKLP